MKSVSTVISVLEQVTLSPLPSPSSLPPSLPQCVSGVGYRTLLCMGPECESRQ